MFFCLWLVRVNDMKNKLIVDRNQAKNIRDRESCEIAVNMRIKEGENNQFRARKKISQSSFLGS